jgi:putative membrane protein
MVAHDPAGWLSPLALLLVAAMLAGYLAAALAERRRGNRWPSARIVFFCAGAALLAVAFLPPLAAWGHRDLGGHMLQHLLVGMLAPLGLVLGAPVSLILRSVSLPAARRLTKVLQSPPVRVITHPLTALVLNVGGMYVLYLTPLYAAAQHSALLHALVHFHFVAAGYLFCWAILAGPDPAPQAPRFAVRLGVLFVAMASHATLGKLMYAFGWPRGGGYTREEIEFAAQLMYYGGDLAEVLLAVALFAMWYQSRGRRYRFLRELEAR